MWSTITLTNSTRLQEWLNNLVVPAMWNISDLVPVVGNNIQVNTTHSYQTNTQVNTMLTDTWTQNTQYSYHTNTPLCESVIIYMHYAWNNVQTKYNHHWPHMDLRTENVFLHFFVSWPNDPSINFTNMHIFVFVHGLTSLLTFQFMAISLG